MDCFWQAEELAEGLLLPVLDIILVVGKRLEVVLIVRDLEMREAFGRKAKC